MRFKHTYFAAEADREAESDRLRALAAFYAEWTQDWLERRAAPRPGMAAMEAGAGSGAMLNWLAARVGPGGRVLGIDLDVSRAGPVDPPARLIRADLFDPPAEPGGFDLVYVRLVLEHLAEPDRAIARLREWLRPGGQLAVVALDFAEVGAADPDMPGAAEFDAAAGALHAAIAESGLVDPAFGRTLTGRFEAAGLADLTEDRMERVIETGSDWARFMAGNARMIGAQVGCDEAAEALARLMERPGLAVRDQRLFGVTGRTPA